jgi:hypothetical protein
MIGLLVKAIQPVVEIITRINKYKADMKAAIGGDKSMLQS